MNQSTQRIIRNKIGLLNLAEELGNVSKACQMMDVSRDTFLLVSDFVSSLVRFHLIFGFLQPGSM